jgi:hypothetical protein
MHIEATVWLVNSSDTMNYGGFIWTMSNFYCTGMLHFKHNYIALLNVEDTNVLIVTYVTIQTHGFSIKTSTYVSESWRHKFLQCNLCCCSDPRTQHKDTYWRIWIMKTHLFWLPLKLMFEPHDPALRYMCKYLNLYAI